MKSERIFAMHACPAKHLFLADKKMYKQKALSEVLNRNLRDSPDGLECLKRMLNIFLVNRKKHFKTTQRHYHVLPRPLKWLS